MPQGVGHCHLCVLARADLYLPTYYSGGGWGGGAVN